MDAVLLAKIQFAFTVAYHFLFVPLSIGIGLVVVLAVVFDTYRSRIIASMRTT